MSNEAQRKQYINARETINQYLKAERGKICKELQKFQKKNPNFIVNARGGKGDERITVNDRRDYFWVDVIVCGARYRLALFYNEVDPDSGNIHTQIGRIQFWKNVQQKGHSGHTPNGWIIQEGDVRRWFLKMENSYTKLKGDPIYIWDVQYETEDVVEQFLDFVEEDQKQRRK